MVKIPRASLQSLIDTLSYAAWMDKVELSFQWLGKSETKFKPGASQFLE